MKKILVLLFVLVLVTSACDRSATVSPTSTEVHPMETATLVIPTSSPTSVEPSSTPIAQPSPVDSNTVTIGQLSIVLPSSLASGASGEDIPPFDGSEAAYWQKTPGHLQVNLGEHYVLQGKFHQPQIYIYPAQAYAEMVPAVFESIRRVNNIIYGPGGTIDPDQLPTVPFFNAAQVFASNIKMIQFQNGSGVRFLTEYSQYAAPVNNHELFYHFQGVTRDGMYYIIAIFPITVPVLADTSDPGAAIPSGGIVYPDMSNPNADFPGYYASIADLLNSTSEEAFSPSIAQLDLLIQSMQINP